ncbi:hypothetical protein WJX77_005648 [Trebouxia sp. C0004]
MLYNSKLTQAVATAVAKYRKTCFVNSTQPGLKLPSCRLSTLLAPTQGHSQMQAVQQEIDREEVHGQTAAAAAAQIGHLAAQRMKVGSSRNAARSSRGCCDLAAKIPDDDWGTRGVVEVVKLRPAVTTQLQHPSNRLNHTIIQYMS